MALFYQILAIMKTNTELSFLFLKDATLLSIECQSYINKIILIII